MKHILTKTSHDKHTLDGKELESKSFLPHDLMHFAYVNITKSNEGFFRDSENAMREEMIVGAMQGAYKDFIVKGEAFDFDDFNHRLNEYLELNEYVAIALSSNTLRKVFNEYEYYYKRWKGMRTGESLIVDVS